ALALGFQNCAKVPLEIPPIELGLSYASGKMELCLQNDLSTYTVESLISINVNVMPFEDELALDSDGDGIPDFKEIEYGFDPYKRRSQSDFMDSVCLALSGSNGCSGTVVACNSERNALGLSDCDIMALGLDQIHSHPNQGIDSDKD